MSVAVLSNEISALIDKEFKTLSDGKFAERRTRLIGKKVISWGVRTSKIRKITRKIFRRFWERPTLGDWFGVSKKLLSTKVFENQMAGIFLLSDFVKNGGNLSISELGKLIEKYVDNWATCDTVSGEVLTRVLNNSPEEIKALDSWLKSEKIWLKRAALVAIVKLKGKIANWQEVAFRALSFSRKEEKPILKKAIRWLEKELF